ncbi:MFS transporter [Corynebacterium sp. 4HC-13]|uniref:MFS transporter n=1 Tax=Corynebacterium anserum TaxID=2684406 RepID=UPI001639A089|nr:MFS transporter [Corynebacterium anserum]MBC2681342.1 MFS transporter [Corynebacterium anserum]
MRHPVAQQFSNKWSTLAILMIGVSLIVLDSTIVSVSLPTIIASLDLNLTEAQWISSLYSVVFAALLLFMGTLGDKWGRTTIFMLGLAVFAGASLLAAVSTGAATLILARGIQGIGGAMILPSTLATINATFRDDDRTAAFGIWGATMASMAAVGPLLGGWLTETFSWHWIFLINVPIAIILIALGVKILPRSRGHIEGFDPIGTTLSAVALGLIVYGLIEHHWWFSFAGLIILCAFIGYELRRLRSHRPALLDVSLFRLPSFSLGNFTALAVSMGEFAALFALPLYLVSVLELGTIHAGWVLATLAAGSIISGGAARHVAAMCGPGRTVVIGLFLEVIGIGITAIILGPNSSPLLIALILALYGAGVGLASAQLASVVLADVPVSSSGMGSATQSTSRQIGSALGIAMAGTVLATTLSHRLPTTLEEIGLAPQQVTLVTSVTSDSAGAAIPQLAEKFGSQLGAVLEQGFSEASAMVFYVSAGILVVGLVASIFLSRTGVHTADATAECTEANPSTPRS